MNRQVVATERLSVSRLHRRWEKKANLPGNRRSDMFVRVNLKAGIRSPSAHPGSPVPAVCSPGVRKNWAETTGCWRKTAHLVLETFAIAGGTYEVILSSSQSSVSCVSLTLPFLELTVFPHDYTCWEKGACPCETPTLTAASSSLSLTLPQIIIWKGTPQLSHFSGIWLPSGETLYGAGLIGPLKAIAECINSPLSPKVSFVMFLAEKQSSRGDKWRRPQYKTAIIVIGGGSGVKKSHLFH